MRRVGQEGTDSGRRLGAGDRRPPAAAWAALGVSVAWGLAACAGAAEEDGVIVQTAPAEVRDMRITAEASGELEPVYKVEVKSKASGEILQLYVDSGDEVEPGTLLARVDPRDVENAHDQATADLDVAQARLSIAEAQLGRSQELLDSEVITAQEYEQQELEHANARAALVRAQTNLELAELRLTDVTIRAPVSGTILERLVENGQVIQSATGNVSGGTTLFVMANLDDMRVRTLVDETDMGQLVAGMGATVGVEAFPDRTFQGRIEKIEPQAVVVQNVTMFPVIVLLDNRSGLLKPGMNAEVEVLVNERLGALTVPNNAVVQVRELAPAAEVLGLDPNVSIDRAAWGPLMAEAAAKAGVQGSPSAAGKFGAGGAGGALAGPMAEVRAKVEAGEITMDSARALFAAARERRQGRRGEGAAAGEGGGAASDRRDASEARAAPEGAPEGAPDGAPDDASADVPRAAAPAGRRAAPDDASARSPAGGRLPSGVAGAAFGPGALERAARGGSTGDPTFQPAVAFVMDEAGVIAPRAVVMGLSDWDYAEILAGLEEGDELALIGAAQLQAQQQERMERMRQRMGGRPFGD